MGRKFTDNIYEAHSNYYVLKIKYKTEFINCYFDKEDYEYVVQKHWRTSHKKNKIYIVTGKSGKQDNPLIYIHNYILHYTPTADYEVDHIDGNSCNNRKNNLRIVSRQENIDNTKVRIDNIIGIRGVSQISASGHWKCDFVYHKKRFYFKDWKTVEEAVYNRKVAEDYFHLETLSKNPLAQQYIDKLSEDQKQTIKQYTYDKISQKETV